MSQLSKAADLLDALKQNCIDAWELTDGTVEYGFQRLPKYSTDFAVIDMLPVQMEPLSARTVKQTYEFSISGFFGWPTSGNILLKKIEKANLLIDQLITGPTYGADLAFLPIVTEVSFDEEDPPQEEIYEVHIYFQCFVEEDHWPGATGA